MVGLGALGTVYAGLLSKGSNEVYGLDLNHVVRKVNETGVRIEGIWGDHHSTRVKAVSDPSSLQGRKWDLIIITVKSFQTAKACEALRSLVSARTIVCLLQNGYGNYETAAAFFPKEQIADIMNRIITETFDLLTAMNQKTLWPDVKSYLEVFYGELLPSTAAHHPSMLQDINNGRKTEIDALNGAIARLAKDGTEALTNQLITDMIKAKNSSNRRQ